MVRWRVREGVGRRHTGGEKEVGCEGAERGGVERLHGKEGCDACHWLAVLVVLGGVVHVRDGEEEGREPEEGGAAEAGSAERRDHAAAKDDLLDNGRKSNVAEERVGSKGEALGRVAREGEEEEVAEVEEGDEHQGDGRAAQSTGDDKSHVGERRGGAGLPWRARVRPKGGRLIWERSPTPAGRTEGQRTRLWKKKPFSIGKRPARGRRGISSREGGRRRRHERARACLLPSSAYELARHKMGPQR